MSIVFFGSPEFAVPSLKALIEAGMTVSAVVSQPDKARGRGRKTSPCPVKACALDNGIKSLTPLNMKDEPFIAELMGLKPEFFAVVAFGRILTPRLLSIPSVAPLNVHASLLPGYRGAAPVAWALMNGEKETGVTTMFMDKGLDTGDILLQETLTVNEHDTRGTLRVRLSEAGGPLLVRTINEMLSGTLKPRPQGEATTDYARMLTKEDGHIDWSKSALEIHNTVKAMSPWPSAFSFLEGKRLKLISTSTLSDTTGSTGPDNIPPGTISEFTKKSITVATGKGSIKIDELQPEGKRAMSAEDFLKGHKITKGGQLE